MSVKNCIAKGLCRLGISPTLLTLGGLALAASSGFLAYEGHFFGAGVVLLASGVFDLFDGAVAREAGKVTVFGGILDSSLDRYGDAFILGGILFYFAGQGNGTAAMLAFSALAGSFSISYIRARAECEIDDCRVGFWERGERIVFLALGLLLNNLLLVLWVLGLFTHWTALQRLWYSKQNARPHFIFSSGRKHPAYYFKVSILVLAVFFLRFQ